MKKIKIFLIFCLFISIPAFSGAQNFDEFLKIPIPGRIEGRGTHFEVKDSDYLNITLESEKEIEVVLESIPRMISLNIASSTEATTTLTLKGLEPNKKYFKYEDTHKNETEFFTDENGSYSWQQDLTNPHHVWFQEKKGTVFLPEYENKYGTWDEKTRTYTLEKDLTESVEIVESNFTFNGNGHSIVGDGSGYGIFLSWEKANNVIIKNSKIKNFTHGILVWFAWGVEIRGNNISEINGDGVHLICSSEVVLSNEISSNKEKGIGIYYYARGGERIQGLIDNNTVSNNYYGMFLLNQQGTIVEKNLSKSNFIGFLLSTGESYDFSSHNEIKENTFTDNHFGLWLTKQTQGNFIYRNNLINNIIQTLNEGENNFFNKEYPIGGNYWSDYKGSDSDGDGIGDTPYCFYGGCDRYPFMRENGWEIVVNQSPMVSNLGQFKSDGITPIIEGGITTESSPDNPYNSLVVFKAVLSDPDNDDVKLEVELKEYNQPFDGQNTIQSDFISSGNIATITRYGLIEGKYKWRARAIDSRGTVSEWMEFGEIGNVDFEVKLVPLYTQIVSPYPSETLTDSWDHLIYAKGDIEHYDCGNTIAQCGCAITSQVMILRFHGVTTTVDTNDVNPGTFNEWLKNNNGYWPDGGVKWAKIQDYSRDEF
jgi:parallel beta-helix repeat protein